MPYEHGSTPVLDAYLAEMEIDESTWKSAGRILDLGSGNGIFALDAARRGKKITSLDLDPSVWMPMDDQIQIAKRRKLSSSEIDLWSDVLSRATAGNMICLPYADESFDVVISRYAYPQALISQTEMKTVLEEVARVLKSGGEARFYPFASERWPSEIRQSAFKALGLFSNSNPSQIELKEKYNHLAWGPKEKVWLLAIYKA